MNRRKFFKSIGVVVGMACGGMALISSPSKPIAKTPPPLPKNTYYVNIEEELLRRMTEEIRNEIDEKLIQQLLAIAKTV